MGDSAQDEADFGIPGIRGDEALFTELLHANRSRIFGHLLTLVQNFNDAEDLYQQTVIVLWEKFPTYKANEGFGSWATTTAHYLALNYFRTRGRRKSLFTDAALDRIAAVEATLASDELARRTDALTICLQSLTERQRSLLIMRYDGGRALNEIAKVQQRSAAAVSVMLARIRKALHSCIERRLATER